MQQEVRPLLIRNPAVRLVRVLAAREVDDEPLVPRLALLRVERERVDERFVAEEEGEAARGGGVKLLEQQALHVRRPALVEPEVGCVRVAGGDQVRIQGRMRGVRETYVTPLPNQECVSSWTTTSTRVRSPARRAATKVDTMHVRRRRRRLTWCKERETGVFLENDEPRVINTENAAYHSTVGERGREHEEVVHLETVGWDDGFLLRQETI